MGFFDSLLSNNNENITSSGIKKTSKVPGFNEEFSTDTSYETQGDDVILYSNKGVQFYNVPNMLKIIYNGTLAASSSNAIYAVVGYGDNMNWEGTEYLQMQKTAQGNCELLTMRKKPGNVNVAFKDSANNWDNNSGQNYIFYDQSLEGSH